MKCPRVRGTRPPPSEDLEHAVHGCDPEDPSWHPGKVTRRQARHIELWSRFNRIAQPDFLGEQWTTDQAHLKSPGCLPLSGALPRC